MRPIRLGIEGFTSFRQPAELDFESLDLFAITGPTGAGKTSIIDAIIYALYGRTPRIGGSCSELISQGAERLRVYLQFTSNDQKYQIVRAIKSGEATKVQLERLDEKGGWEPLSNKVVDVRDKIDEIIGIDFEGFTKSVVLPQGEFDRFLRGDTADRRHIISELLNLNVYVEMGKLARQRADNARREIALLHQHLAEAYVDVTREKQQELAGSVKAMQKNQQRVTGELTTVRDLHPVAADLQHWRKSRADTTRELESSKERLKAGSERAEAALKEAVERGRQISELERAIQMAGYEDALYHELLTVVPVARQRADLTVSIARTEEEHSTISKQIDEAQPSLLKAQKTRDGAAAALEGCEGAVAKAKEVYLAARKEHGSADAVRLAIEEFQRCSQLESEKTELLRDIDARETRLKIVEDSVVEARRAEETARTDWEEAKRKLEELRQLHAVDDIRRQLKSGLACPVCEQVVSAVPKPEKHELLDRAKEAADRKQTLVEKVHESLIAAAHLVESLPPEIKRLKKRLGALDAGIAAILRKLECVLGKRPGLNPVNELDWLAKHLAALEEGMEQAIEQCSSAAEKHSRAQENLTLLEHKLDLLRQQSASLESDINDKKRELTSLEKTLRGGEDLTVLEKQLANQKKARSQTQDLEAQKKKQETLRGQSGQNAAVAQVEVKTFEQRITEQQSQLQRAESEATKLEGKIRKELKLPDGSDELKEVERRRAVLDREAQELAAKIALAKADLDRVTKDLAELGEKRRQIKGLQEVTEIYGELGTALRADQFIRFVEEEAMERLAQDGSEYLLRLSSGRYEFSVKDENFLVEDHWNADDSRSVNTLSGGESFLASLALALALSDTLGEFAGNRASFSLDSLFLDEGFSTLDPETLDVVVQGIEALAGADRVIGVISHVPELAERFPVQIQVKKAIGGSTIHIRGSGEPRQTVAAAR